MRAFATPKQKRSATRVVPPRRQCLAASGNRGSTLRRAKIRHILHGPRFQPKLAAGVPDDEAEREVERVAGEIVGTASLDEERQSLGASEAGIEHLLPGRVPASPPERQPTSPGGRGPTCVSPAPPSIQRDLTPPGNCIQGIHDELQRLVKAWCDHPSGRACTPGESCHRLRQKIRRNQLCAQHRRTINDRCYDGGNLGHRIAERDARRAQATCMALFRANCERQPEREPVRVPVNEPVAHRIAEWAEEVLREGRDAVEAAEEFLRNNPELAGVIAAAGIAAIIVLVADDATLAGIADDVLIPLIGSLEWVALRMSFGF